MATVHVFGNSLAYGLYGLEDDWSTRLKLEGGKRRLRGEQPYITVSNHAAPGNMLVHSLRSGQITANVACNRRGRQLGIFSVGGTESCILYPEGETRPRRSLSDFQRDLANLTNVIADLNNGCGKAVFAAIFTSSIPVDEEKARRVWGGDIFSDTRFTEYDAVVMAYASQTGASYLDLRTGFDSTSMLAADAIHPNQIGSRFIYEKIATAVFSWLGLTSHSDQALGHGSRY
jgi:hypothetical protein